MRRSPPPRVKTVASPWRNLSIAAWAQSCLNRGCAYFYHTARFTAQGDRRPRGVPVLKVYASQWLRPKKLRIFESEGVESTENVEMGNQSIVQTMTMPNFKARKAESEKRSKREARAFAFPFAIFCCLFSFKSRTLRLRARCHHSIASVGRPYSG